MVAIGAVTDALWHFPTADNTRILNLSHCRIFEQIIPLVCGGDLTSPVNSVADAIASGKQTAMALHTYFEKGQEAVDSTLAACRVGPGPALCMDAYLGGPRQNRNPHVVTYDEIVIDYFQTAPRVTSSTLDANRRRQSFTEIESTLTDKVAVVDCNFSFGAGGIFAQEIRAALCNLGPRPQIFGFIAGLGGRDITPQTLAEIYNETKKSTAPAEESIWIGLNQEIVVSWRN